MNLRRGEDDPATLTIANNLAATLQGQNKQTEAVAMQREVLVRCSSIPSSQHPLATSGDAKGSVGTVLFPL
jgi:hypothetical protein